VPSERSRYGNSTQSPGKWPFRPSANQLAFVTNILGGKAVEKYQVYVRMTNVQSIAGRS